MGASQRAASKNDFRCPICGALESNGGCKKVKDCIRALAAAERQSTRKYAAVAKGNSHARRIRILVAAFEALSKLRIGIILCSASGQVINFNPVAEQIVASRDGLAISADGFLCGTAKDEPRITDLLQEAPRTGEVLNRRSALSIQRGPHRRPLLVFVSAVCWGNPGTILLIVLDSARAVAEIEPQLRHLFGFTSAEARLANLLLDGKSLEDCCRQLGVQRSTGCTHLRRLFKKTGVRRQSELVALLLKSIGLAYPSSSPSPPAFPGLETAQA